MYEHIYWGGAVRSLLTACPDLYDRTITINGVSKSYAMTGWRIGYRGGPPTIVEAMSTIQGQSTSNPPAIAQKAAVVRIEWRPGLRRRDEQATSRPATTSWLPAYALPGIPLCPGRGTFYAFCDVSGAIRHRLSRTTARSPSSCRQGRGRGRAGHRLRRARTHSLLVRGQPADAGEGAGADGPSAARRLSAIPWPTGSSNPDHVRSTDSSTVWPVSSIQDRNSSASGTGGTSIRTATSPFRRRRPCRRGKSAMSCGVMERNVQSVTVRPVATEARTRTPLSCTGKLRLFLAGQQN